MKIGIFGGSFNPPHKGHVRLSEEMYDYLGLDAVTVVPSNVSPFKTDNGGVSNEDRFEMCRLAFSDEKYIISDMEMKRGGKSYTVDTVHELARMHPEDELFLFMGADMLLSFHLWHRYEEILDCVKICAMVRDGENDFDDLMKYAGSVLDRPDRVIVAPIMPFEVSSTQVRDMIRRHDENVGYYIDEKVKEYIESRRLYIE